MQMLSLDSVHSGGGRVLLIKFHSLRVFIYEYTRVIYVCFETCTYLAHSFEYTLIILHYVRWLYSILIVSIATVPTASGSGSFV